MEGDGFTRREIAVLLVAVAVLFTGGTVGFMALLDALADSWSKYTTVKGIQDLPETGERG